MSGITLTQAQTQLEAWLAADAAVAKNQSYSVADRSYARADAKEITNKINYWSSMVDRLSRGSGGPRVTRVIPRDI